MTVTLGPRVGNGIAANLIDGSHAADEWTLAPNGNVGSCEESLYVTIDLGAVYTINSATVWHYCKFIVLINLQLLVISRSFLRDYL